MDNVSESLVDIIGKLKEQGASKDTVKKSYFHYMDIYARKKRIPLHGSFELTPLCNLDCKMCYIHLKPDKFSKDQLLHVDQWKNLAIEAHGHGMLHTTLTGGECLTYPWFDDLYLFFRKLGIVPNILSNGLLLDKERIRFFSKYPPKHIQISLYGSSDDAYEKVTGYRVFNKVYRNLELLKEAHLKVSLALTPNPYMQGDIKALQLVAKSLGLPYGINANLIEPRENTGRKLVDIGNEQHIEAIKVWKEIRYEELIPVDPFELPEPNKGGKKTVGLLCGGGRSSFNIRYDGIMTPCPSLSEVTTEPFKDGFINAWNQLNKLASEFPMPVECPECIYHDYCLQCPAIHKNAHRPGHCDPRICERTKRLIQVGYLPKPEGI